MPLLNRAADVFFRGSAGPVQFTRLTSATARADTAGESFLLRATSACQDSRLTLQSELARAALAPAPMHRDGIMCFEHEELHVSCTEWVRGEALPGRIRHRETAAQVGWLLGLLHDYEPSANPAAHPLIGFSHPTSLSDARETHETPGRDKEVLHLLDLKSELARGRDISAAIEHRRVRDGVAHGDVHPANIVRFRNDLALIDWESLRAEGQWYERLRVILWCLHPTPWIHGFDRDLLKAFADAYISKHRVEHWDWAEDVEDFTTLLLIDGGPYVADASPRTKAFARDRLRLAEWLMANRLSVIEALATLFGKKTRHAH